MTHRYDGVRVTLNGEPAVICGYRHDFATVRAIKSGVAFEWSWRAVDRIVSKGGEFRS